VTARYTTINVLRTIEAILGLKPLGLNDALAAPMADLFDPANSDWSYRAEAAEILRATALPISPDRFRRTKADAASKCPRRSAEYWAVAMRGQDFQTEDKLDTNAFNRALWRGLGAGSEPGGRDGRDLREDRAAKMKTIEPAPCAVGAAAP
jgi:hypothetical protein